jgi:TPR repeat protein
MNRTFKAAVAALVVAVGFAAGPYEDGLAAYVKGDYATALRLWHPLAEQGNALAQAKPCLMYYEGHGVPQDYTAAMSWYRKAAEQGHADSAFDISGSRLCIAAIEAIRLFNGGARFRPYRDFLDDHIRPCEAARQDRTGLRGALFVATRRAAQSEP